MKTGHYDIIFLGVEIIVKLSRVLIKMAEKIAGTWNFVDKIEGKGSQINIGYRPSLFYKVFILWSTPPSTSPHPAIIQ